MKKNQIDKIQQAFIEEFYRVVRVEKGLIHYILYKSLGSFPEAAHMEQTVTNCILDIERILLAQFNAKPNEIRNNRECQRKVTEFMKSSTYVRKYTLEAVKSFARKKRYYWTHGQNKPKKELKERHVERKAGRAARVHGKGDKNQVHEWFNALNANGLSTASFSEEKIMAINQFLNSIGLNDKKVKCFWDRLEGYTFEEMVSLNNNEKGTSDMYRKRYKRLMERLETKSAKFKEIMLGKT